MSQRKLDWLEQHYKALVEEHEGRWVAIGESGVAAVGDDDYDTWLSAKAAGVRRPLVILVKRGAWTWR